MQLSDMLDLSGVHSIGYLKKSWKQLVKNIATAVRHCLRFQILTVRLTLKVWCMRH